MTDGNTGLIDQRGQTVTLGDEVGKGGEGGVFAHGGDRGAVVKLYHQRPLPADQVAKLEAMVSLASDSLRAISAWPSSLVITARSRQACGIVMPRIADARHLHELYGTLNRRKHFPEVGWHHMVLAARNTAAAFHTVHQAGVVVGDVNQGNLLVDAEMRVRLIDCDSFQIRVGDQRYNCPVGTPHFTPPELQSLTLRDVERTANHDNFGLAVLIFHLLFMGRHPFAGRYLGPEEMTIEKAIAERRFAFSANKNQTQVEPPSASLLLEELPPEMAELFERAFRPNLSRGELRPTASDWVNQLDKLIQQRRDCEFDPTHIYYSGLDTCPWCRIEDSGGPAFFVAGGEESAVSEARLKDLNQRVKRLTLAEFPDLAPAQLEPPKEPHAKKKGSKDAKDKKKKQSDRPSLTPPDVLCWGYVLAIVVIIFSVVTPYAILVGGAISLLTAVLLWREKEAKSRRDQLQEFRRWLAEGLEQIAASAHKIERQHEKNAHEFRDSRAEIEQQIKDYNAEGKALVKVLVQHMDTKRDELLRNQLIRDRFREITGLTSPMVSILESYGVESAYDIEKINLYGIPMITNAALLGLLAWREKVERTLVLQPDHGVTPEQLSIATESATRRYKVAQARRVLNNASRLRSVAKSAGYALERQLKDYRTLGRKWKEMAQERDRFQQDRLPLERRCNDTTATLFILAGVLPFVGAIAWLLAG